MISLILDTTYTELIVALASNNQIIDTIRYDCWQRQSEYAAKEVENILKRNNIDPKNVNEVIVTNGPGSYTGVRIALTIAKTYCFALNIPCYVLSSLQVLETEGKTSICLINARANRSYIGVYKDDECILKDQIMTNEEVLNYIKKHQYYDVCGDLDYLDIENNHKSNIPENMIRLKSDKNKIDDVLKLKAIYLKD